MSGLEIPGLVLGAAAIALAFKGAVDTALFIEAFLSEEKSDCTYLALSFHIERTRLQLWGEHCNIDSRSRARPSTFASKPAAIRSMIVQILGHIEKLNREAERLVGKHQIQLPESVSSDDLHPRSGVIQGLSRLTVKPRSTFRWAVKGKAEFEDIVLRLRKLITDLESFSVDDRDAALLSDALASRALIEIGRLDILSELDSPENKVDRALALAARAKHLQLQARKEPAKSVSLLNDKELRFLKNSKTLGLLSTAVAPCIPVWVEWTEVEEGPGARAYVERIEALGNLLQQVSEPELRLPPCYGVYNDVSFESENGGSKRLAYVFGVPGDPQEEKGQRPKYDSNLRERPPMSLDSLIQADPRITPIPLLGDRFRLAYTLAVAFSRFHAAGWLHKGLHSKNIIFFHPEDGHGVTATEPFITGFEYSRPQDKASLSRGPLEDEALAHYYHPDADKGFSEQKDLYSLGVVLCEIGRWGLVASSVSERTRKKMVTRSDWRDYLTKKVVADLGWRMGKTYQSVVETLLLSRLPTDEDDEGFFAQQYWEKVIRPLKSCSA